MLAEFVGTALLLLVVVGAIGQAQRLSHDPGVQLIGASVATGAGLVAILLALGPVSGAHLNPVVTLADVILGRTRRADVPGYLIAQVLGGGLGVVVSNVMFDLDPVSIATGSRSSAALWLAEAVATFGLILAVYGVVHSGRPGAAPFAVGGYIAAAFWFTSSNGFANPALTLARTLTDTAAGLPPSSAALFVTAQLVGAAVAVAAARFFYPYVIVAP